MSRTLLNVWFFRGLIDELSSSSIHSVEQFILENSLQQLMTSLNTFKRVMKMNHFEPSTTVNIILGIRYLSRPQINSTGTICLVFTKITLHIESLLIQFLYKKYSCYYSGPLTNQLKRYSRFWTNNYDYFLGRG